MPEKKDVEIKEVREEAPEEEGPEAEVAEEDPNPDLAAELLEYRDLLQRKQAEFENYRRRVTGEKQHSRLEGRTEVLREVLLVLDACGRGLESLEGEPEASDVDSFRQGYELLVRQLRTLLQRFGVEEVSGVGSRFDPNVHEAVVREPSDEYPEGTIMEEFRKGYRMEDRLLRPSQVKVSAGSE